MQFLLCVLSRFWGLFHTQNTPPGRRPGGNLIRCLSHLNLPLCAEEQWLCLKLLPGDWVPHPVPEGAHTPLTEETHFSRLFPHSCSFGHYPKLVTISEGSNVDQQVNRELFCNRKVQRSHHCRCRTDPPVDVTLHARLFIDVDVKRRGQATLRYTGYRYTVDCCIMTNRLKNTMIICFIHLKLYCIFSPLWLFVLKL